MILTLAASASIVASCHWDNPRGARRLVIPPSSVVDNYRDIPVQVRKKLKARMDRFQWEDIAEIRKGAIRGAYEYSDIRHMHFGTGQACLTVSLENWSPADVERGLVYCESGHCLIVPTVCTNVSRISRGRRVTPTPDTPETPSGISAGTTTGQTLTFEPMTVSAGFPLEAEAATHSFESMTVDAPWPWSLVPIPESPRPVWLSYGQPLISVPVDSSGSFLPGIDGMPERIAEPIPEPGTYVLMLLGLGLVAWAARRKRAV